MDDKQIIDLFFARDEAAIEETMEKYGGLCRKIAMNILDNDLDAEECENDVYSALWRSIPPNRPKFLSSYIAKMARNAALSKLRYMSSRMRDTVLLPSDELAEFLPETDRPAGEIARAISGFLRVSSAEERRIFVRHYFSGETFEQIAADEGITSSKIKSLLFRMRNKLRVYLEKEGITV